MIARQDAKEAGADEAFFLSEKGYLTEAASSNLFLVKNAILKTPRYESGIYPALPASWSSSWQRRWASKSKK